MNLVKYVRDNIGHQHIVTTLCRQERTMKTDNVKVNLIQNTENSTGIRKRNLNLVDLILKVLAFFFTFGASVEIQLRNESKKNLDLLKLSLFESSIVQLIRCSKFKESCFDSK